MYWKNGTAVYLSDGMYNSKATGIAVVGTDVYVAGEAYQGRRSVATYWKNGTSVRLTDGNNDAKATGITVVGHDIYVVGHEKNSKGNYVAKYWKNGTAVSLSDGSHYKPALAVAVMDNNVYAERSENELVNNAVDIFFTSLASDFREKAAGIVLSGGGSDGFKGSIAIKDNSGFVMVQSPESSQFSSMPETIINHHHLVINAAPAKLAAEQLKRINLFKRRSVFF